MFTYDQFAENRIPRGALVVLAVTRMKGGFCIAGVQGDGRWVRPVKEFGSLLLGDITYRDGQWMRPFDVVALRLQDHRPEPPHVEDWTCDFVRQPPRLLRRMAEDERSDFLRAHLDMESESLMMSESRSLALCAAGSFSASFSLDRYSGKYEARIRIPWAGNVPMPCTDLKWRAWGRSLLRKRGGDVVVDEAGARAALGFVDKVFVVLGLSRPFQGKYWPMVVGVHTIPDYVADVDYRNA